MYWTQKRIFGKTAIIWETYFIQVHCQERALYCEEIIKPTASKLFYANDFIERIPLFGGHFIKNKAQMKK